MSIINKFVEEYDSERTKLNYTSQIESYYKFLKIKPEKYFTETRNYEEDIKKYWKYLKLKTKSKCTRNTYLFSIKQFLIFNDVELSVKFWKSLKGKSVFIPIKDIRVIQIWRSKRGFTVYTIHGEEHAMSFIASEWRKVNQVFDKLPLKDKLIYEEKK